MLAPVLRRQVLQHTRIARVALPSLARWYASFPPHSVVKMPALSPTMTAGNIGAWNKKPGDSIAPGEVLVEIETDKAQMDFEFQEEGVLAKILKEQGEKDVPVGNPIAIMVEEGTDVSAFEGFTLADAGGEATPAAPKKEESAPASSAPSSSPTPAPEPESSAPSGKLEPALDRVLVAEKDAKKASSSAAPAGAAPAAAFEDVTLSNMRKTIANRLKESWNENPHYFVSSTLSVSKLLKLRQALNSSSDGKYKLSVNDFLIKAIAVASQKVPAVNASWQGDSIRQYSSVDVSVAVATPNGLITPIVRGVEGKGLESISNTVKELAKKARENKLQPSEYQGGSITISNLGMNMAVERFTAIINPPQAAILAVGTSKKVAVPVENADGTTGVEWEEQITVTASFDHRVIDGAVGGEWTRELKKVIENPLELLL